MKWYNNIPIQNMDEEVNYPIEQNKEYSDGVFITKSNNSISIRHFWLKKVDEDDYYVFDEKKQVWYPKNEEDLITIIHKDVISLSPYVKNVTFEEMTLEQFYDGVFIGVCHDMIAIEGYELPENLVGKVTEEYGASFN